ncbi:HprK-related kinase A [Azoarcus sp. PA01]|nr:HprK-related kinase A [Azoarcus sp. PA01]
MSAALDYRLLDVGAARIAVASSLEAFHRHLDAVYPHQEVLDAAAFADVRMSLLLESAWRLRARHVELWSEGRRAFEPYPANSALPLFEWGGNWLLAQRLNAYLLLHAGIVARDDKALVLPAEPGSGKSTLTCALHLAGWRFLSDEFGVIDPESDEILPMLKPAALKNQSIEVIGARPGAVVGPVFPKTRKGDVAHFVPDRRSFEARHRRAQARLIVFPRYQSDARLRSRRIPVAQAALRLGLNSFNYHVLGPVGFGVTTRLARRAHAHELVYGDLDEAVAHIETLFRDTA